MLDDYFNASHILGKIKTLEKASTLDIPPLIIESEESCDRHFDRVNPEIGIDLDISGLPSTD